MTERVWAYVGTVEDVLEEYCQTRKLTQGSGEELKAFALALDAAVDHLTMLKTRWSDPLAGPLEPERCAQEITWALERIEKIAASKPCPDCTGKESRDRPDWCDTCDDTERVKR